jgi:hypothetical protein
MQLEVLGGRLQVQTNYDSSGSPGSLVLWPAARDASIQATPFYLGRSASDNLRGSVTASAPAIAVWPRVRVSHQSRCIL